MPNRQQAITWSNIDPVNTYIDGLVQDCSNSSANALELMHWSYYCRLALSHQHITTVTSYIMNAMASLITGASIVYSTVCSDADQRKHESSASLAFVRGIHRWPVNSPHKGPVMRKMFPFDDVIMMHQEAQAGPHQHLKCMENSLCHNPCHVKFFSANMKK